MEEISLILFICSLLLFGISLISVPKKENDLVTKNLNNISPDFKLGEIILLDTNSLKPTAKKFPNYVLCTITGLPIDNCTKDIVQIAYIDNPVMKILMPTKYVFKIPENWDIIKLKILIPIFPNIVQTLCNKQFKYGKN